MRENILKAPKKSKETMKIDSDDDVFQRFFVDHHHHGVLSIDRLPTDFHTLYHLYFWSLYIHPFSTSHSCFSYVYSYLTLLWFLSLDTRVSCRLSVLFSSLLSTLYSLLFLDLLLILMLWILFVPLFLFCSGLISFFVSFHPQCLSSLSWMCRHKSLSRLLSSLWSLPMTSSPFLSFLFCIRWVMSSSLFFFQPISSRPSSCFCLLVSWTSKLPLDPSCIFRCWCSCLMLCLLCLVEQWCTQLCTTWATHQHWISILLIHKSLRTKEKEKLSFLLSSLFSLLSSSLLSFLLSLLFIQSVQSVVHIRKQRMEWEGMKLSKFPVMLMLIHPMYPSNGTSITRTFQRNWSPLLPTVLVLCHLMQQQILVRMES